MNCKNLFFHYKYNRLVYFTQLEDYKEWYIDKRPTYESLLATVKSIIESLLRRENIRFYHVETRVKEFDEFEAKLADQKYTQPEEMTDFAALGLFVI